MLDMFLFSGGLDSTLMIEEALAKFPSREIYLFSFNDNRLDDRKRHNEIKAREQIVNYWKQKYPKANIITTDININTIITGQMRNREPEVHKAVLVQPVMWLLNIQTFLRSDAKIHIAYLMGEDEFYFEREIRDLAKAIKPFYPYDIELLFPFRHQAKVDIIKRYCGKNLLDLMNLCHFCEWPHSEMNDEGMFKECGFGNSYVNCEPCKNFIESCMAALPSVGPDRANKLNNIVMRKTGVDLRRKFMFAFPEMSQWYDTNVEKFLHYIEVNDPEYSEYRKQCIAEGRINAFDILWENRTILMLEKPERHFEEILKTAISRSPDFKRNEEVKEGEEGGEERN